MSFAETQNKAKAAWDEFASLKCARILVGAGSCGKAAGAEGVIAEIRACLKNLNIDASMHEVGCFGMCYAEPLVELTRSDGPRVLCGPVTKDKVRGLLEGFFKAGIVPSEMAVGLVAGKADGGPDELKDNPVLSAQRRIALRNCGVIDPENLDHYLARGGYSGLAKALAMTPEAVIAEVKNSGLRGRGGAGFPTGVKWELCRKNPGDLKYMICNADEGDPGAFMDRSVCESDPHSVLEGMAIAAYAIGAREGYVYVRAEYPLAIKRLVKAIAQAEKKGLLGEDILGKSFAFKVKIKRGAGAFVCGEETALIASIEGKRGTPRPRPPFPAQSGLWGKPTNINNVETLANVPVIMERGPGFYAGFGTEKSKGTKTFALAGKVARTGLIEVPLGIKLRDIVFGIGGGIAGGRKFKAVQTGGPSGGCIPESMLDLQVEYEQLAQAGSIMGSGGMVVMDEDSCMVDIARYFLEFTQSESCGKCVPCRVGTRQLLTILERICAGKGKETDIEELETLAVEVKAGSLCGLGQTAPNPVLTTLRYFREEYEGHVLKKQCPSFMCTALINFNIDGERCIGCGACKRACPVGAISGEAKKLHIIDQKKCIKCGSCLISCPQVAAAVYRTSGELTKFEPQQKKPMAKGK